MNIPVLVMVLVYEFIVCIGIGLFLIIRDKRKANLDEGDNFALAGRKMGYATLIPTMALTALGNAHFTGMFQMSFDLGATAMWFIFGNTCHFVVLCLCTGPWIRKMEVATVSQAIEKLYGKKICLAISCAMSGVTFGVLTVECQGMGLIFSSLTNFPLVTATIIVGIFGIFYVIIAGMKEVGAVNLVNIIVLYIGVIFAVFFIGKALPGGSFDYVTDTLMANTETEFMTKLFASPSLWFSFALANIISTVFYGPVSQANCQAPMSAKNAKVIRRSLWVVAIINGMFGVFSVSIGLAARTLPEYAAAGANNAALHMMIDMLPAPVCAAVLAAALAACLSSFAMTALGCGTMFGYDIYKGLFNPKASEKQVAWVIRIVVLILCVVAIAISVGISSIVGAMNWVFAWIVPVFWLFIFGLFWKRSAKVAGVALAVTWIANCLWSLTSLPSVFGTTADAVPNGYVTLIVGLVCIVIGNLCVKGEPGIWSKKAGGIQVKPAVK